MNENLFYLVDDLTKDYGGTVWGTVIAQFIQDHGCATICENEFGEILFVWPGNQVEQQKNKEKKI